MGKEREGQRRNGYFLLDLNSFSSSSFLKFGIWDMVICIPILPTFLFFSLVELLVFLHGVYVPGRLIVVTNMFLSCKYLVRYD